MVLWQLKDRLSPTLRTSCSGESWGRPRPLASPLARFLLLFFSPWFHFRHSSEVSDRPVFHGGAGGGQYWVQHILCTAKARLLLVWRMADSLGCVDKLLITTNGNLIHLSFINGYFSETNKQKVICLQKDDVSRLPMTNWHPGSWPLLWVVRVAGSIPNIVLVFCSNWRCWLHWWALHWPSVELVTLFWLEPQLQVT